MKIKITLLLLSLGQIAFSQIQNPCESFGQFPISFEGQKCWLTYSLKQPIFIFGDKLNSNGINYKTLNLPNNLIDSFFIYNKGLNDFYLDKNHTAWGGNYYPCKIGGIAHRYNSPNGDAAETKKLNWQVIKSLSPEELYKLSPAEKMDIYLDDSTFSITKYELLNRGTERKDRSDDGFCGYCNGARMAGIITPEPRHNVRLWSYSTTNPIEVNFSVGDIKALLSASYMHPSNFFSFGLPSDTIQNDPNPAILDVLIRLYLGHNKIPFVIDASYGKSIFNETVLGYKRSISTQRNLNLNEQKRFSRAKKAVDVNLVLYLQDELCFDQSQMETITIMADSSMATKEVSNCATFGTWVHKTQHSYTLFLDSKGYIINGDWKKNRIDYAWAANGDGNEDEHIKPIKAPDTPENIKDLNLRWDKLSFILSKSLE